MPFPNPQTPNPNSHTVVIGGGVAGIAAAVRLAEAGAAVTLIEMRPRLGGRATSMEDPQTGQLLDNCQHVVMRCCKALMALYEKLGVADRIVWHRRFDFVHGDGTRDGLAAGWLPAPMHFTGSFLKFRGLGWRDKLAIARAMHEIYWHPPRGAEVERINTRSFADWLEQRKQPRRAVERFWGPTVVSACNETLDRVAAGYGLQVFREGFLASKRGYEMGLADVPLAELYGPAINAIEATGGQVVTATVKSFDYDTAAKRLRAAILNDGRRLEADGFVSALPFDVLDRVAGDAMKADDARLQRLKAFEVSPIIGLHLWVRSPGGGSAMAMPHVALTGSPMHWFFNQGWDDGRGAQHLHGVVSAAHDLVDLPNSELLDLAMRELRKLVPGCVDAALVEGRVIKERRATFSCLPGVLGVDAIRPSTGGAIANLMLAGDWCHTGWPATMEGAARSGFAAAEYVLV